jgi:hypothetical protein
LKPLRPQATSTLIATGHCHKHAEVLYSAAHHRVFFTVRNLSN